MTFEQRFLWLVAGLGTILIIATVIGWVLARRGGSDGTRAVVANLNARVKSWWMMVGVFAVAFFVGRGTTLILFAAMSFFAFREFVTLTPTRPADRRALFGAFFLLLPAQYLLIWYEWYGLFAILIPVYGFLLLPALSALSQDTELFLERVAKIQWGVMIAIYCISHAPALLVLEIPGYDGANALLLFWLLLVVQMSDVLQYVAGKLFGRTKVAPVVSPSKTVEGLVGGGVAAVVVGAAMWWITPFTPIEAAGMALVIVVMGFLGGLALSAVKRSIGVKDWGVMIKGHGGVLDRMDSLSFAAPIFFHLTRYFFER